MTSRTLDIVEEPRGDVMARLLRALGQHSSVAMMVLRDGFEFDESARALLTRLAPNLIDRRRSASWPGTVLLSEEATTLRFVLNEAVVGELIAAADGLFEWKHPALPEDLALLRGDGTVIYGSICHEGDAFLDLTAEEYETLCASVPELATICRARVLG